MDKQSVLKHSISIEVQKYDNVPYLLGAMYYFVTNYHVLWFIRNENKID